VVNGDPLITAASAQKSRMPNRYVQIGTASAPNITLPGIALRSSAIQLMGSGIGSVALEQILRVLSD
jgi:hypothetical protein